jgi:acyl-CoA synthetase (AMP-forming)/AMP-acid ligase II
MGVQPGDRVAGLEDNNLGAADFLVGCAVAGAVRVPLYPRNSRTAHQYMVEHTQCKVVLADGTYADSVTGLEREIADLDHVVIRDADYEEWLAGHDDTDPDVAISEDDWYIIRHSGGTTGRAKGVGYTHHDWLVVCRNWLYPVERLTSASAVGHAAPISHGSGYLFVPGWLHGVPNVLFGRFETGTVLDLMEQHRVSHMFAVPTVVHALAHDPSAAGRDWSNLKAILIGGAPITDDSALLARRVFGNSLYQLYGLTEIVPISFMDSRDWFGEVGGSTPLRSAGKIMPFAEVEIRGEDGSALPMGQEGEIVAKAEGQMRGYWGDDELDASRVVEGWIRTGDVGKVDANGYLYILDRVDDMIVSGGFNIWPAELETVIADHPAVLEVAVFAVPDDRWGETPLAVCCVDQIEAVTAEEIIELCRVRLGSYKKPSRVEFTTEPLPKSVVGKLQRKVLREPYWAGRERRVAGN